MCVAICSIKNPLSINKITLLNTKLNITKESPFLDIKWNLKRSIISITNQNYTFNIDAFSRKLVVGAIDYINSKKIDVIAKTQIKRDTITILSSRLYLEELIFTLLLFTFDKWATFT